MEQTAAEKVCTIRERIANRIGDNRYRTWFGGSTEFELDGERLGVHVPNAFVGNWISANFLSQLEEVTREVLGGEPRVHVRIHENGNQDGDGVENESKIDAGRKSGQTGDSRSSLAGRPADARPTLRGELATFVVGPSNELAFSVASAVMRNPGSSFKHLVIHGGCGLGKTHLLQGLCNGLSRARPDLQWMYLSGEEFTNEYIYALKSGRIDFFRSRFRNVDLLVLDDIHFLADKKATQEEFLHTFNAIDATGKAVVLSSDRHPRSITKLSEPLMDRLIASMVVRINAPDYATRREIITRRAAAMSCELPEDVLDFLARSISRNVRELEGALYKLAAYASLTKDPICVSLAQKVVEDYVVATRPPDAGEIELVVAKHFGVTREALHSASRDRTVTQARGMAMYLVRKHTRMSFPEIGRAMGDKQHSTVLMAVRRIQELIDRDGAVTWRTPAGMQDAPARGVLDTLEQQLVRGQDVS